MAPPDVLEGHLLISKVHNSKEKSMFAVSHLQFLNMLNSVFWFRLPPATKVPCSRPSPCRGAEKNGKKEAETGGSG